MLVCVKVLFSVDVSKHRNPTQLENGLPETVVELPASQPIQDAYYFN